MTYQAESPGNVVKIESFVNRYLLERCKCLIDAAIEKRATACPELDELTHLLEMTTPVERAILESYIEEKRKS